MPRAKFLGYLSLLFALLLGGLFIYFSFIQQGVNGNNFTSLSFNNMTSNAYYTFAIPILIVSFFVIGTGFWIGLTILTIKVVPPMPEIVEKKDSSKIKAFFLCIVTLALAVILGYGIYIKSFWALAVPAIAISIVILGAIFWVGFAIITTRSTLPVKK